MVQARLGLVVGTSLIGGVGRLSREKGFDLLLKAFAVARKDFPQPVLVIAGDGIERKRLERLAAPWG